MEIAEGYETHVKFRSVVQTVLKGFASKLDEEWSNVSLMFDKPEFKHLVKNINGFVLIFNYKTCHYEFCSEGIHSNLGYKAEDFLGNEGASRVYALFHPEQAPYFANPVLHDVLHYLTQHATPETGKDFRFACCMKLRNTYGDYFWYILDTLILQTDDQGLPHRTIVTCTNIDHFKKNDLIYYHVMRKNTEGMYQIVFQNQVNQHPQKPLLSNREIEILVLIGQSLTNQQIAAKLFLSLKTVQTHRRNILKKTDCKGAAELTQYAFSRGLI